jgi:hypothetical protein
MPLGETRSGVDHLSQTPLWPAALKWHIIIALTKKGPRLSRR